jgi:hypothetical protein
MFVTFHSAEFLATPSSLGYNPTNVTTVVHEDLKAFMLTSRALLVDYFLEREVFRAKLQMKQNIFYAFPVSFAALYVGEMGQRCPTFYSDRFLQLYVATEVIYVCNRYNRVSATKWSVPL